MAKISNLMSRLTQISSLITYGLFLSSANFHVNAVSTCWYPDGATTEPGHVPCNQTTNAASSCCSARDACAGGLCLSINGPYRGSCTDQSWNSPNCAPREWPQCITDPSSRRRYNRATPILSCSSPGIDGQSVCCGYSNGSSCCNDQFRIGNVGAAFTPGFDVLITGLSSTAGSNTTNITTVPSTTAEDIGTKVGLGVGIPLSLLVAGIIGFLFYRECNKKKFLKDPTSLSTLANQNSPTEQQTLYQNYSNPQTIPVSNPQSYPVSNPPQPQIQENCSPRASKPEPVFEAPESNVHEMRG